MTRAKLPFIFLVLISSTGLLFSITNPFTFSIADRGLASYQTGSGTGELRVGHARVEANAGSTTPAGFLMFRFKPADVLVTEATVPASRAVTSGRIYVEVEGGVNTGLAIANPNSQPANITFYFTDAAGTNFGQGTTTVAANSQISRFVNQAPFNVGSSARGTMTFTSDVPVSVITLRGFTNERSEFLITTLPVVELGGSASGTILFPHYASGGGWTTQVVLINPTDSTIGGSVQFLGAAGSTAAYSIAPRSSQTVVSTNTGAAINTGGVLVTPAAGNASPSGLSIFSFKVNGVTVSEAGVPVLRPGNAFRMPIEECGDYPGQLQSGIAIANPSTTTSAVVTMTLTDTAGAATGMTSTVTLPPSGHIASFTTSLPGFGSVPYPFHGVLRITTTAPGGVSVIGLRGRYNQRNDFLITTAMPTDETTPTSTSPMYFPHLADGGGYSTEFILYSGSTGQASSGNLRFFTQTGAAMN